MSQGHLANKGAQQRLAQTEKQRRVQTEGDLRQVMATPFGRRFVWRLIDEVCNLHGGSFTGNSQTFFNEGRRDVGITIAQEIQRTCPTEWLSMVGEALRSKQQDEQIRKVAVSSAETEDGAGSE